MLRDLGDSQGWLAEHDLADTRVVHVTEEEVQHATAIRTAPQIPSGGLKASFKRFGDIFGLGGHNLLRRSTRRDRSKSVSSTTASISTSAWDGRSEPSRSRGASRQASIVKKKSSTSYSTKSGHPGSEDLPSPTEQQDMDSNALVSHAMALKRKLVNAKAARDAHEAALSISCSSAADSAPSPYSTSPRPNHNLSRSVSGESSHSNLPDDSSSRYGGRRQSVGSHLQPPIQTIQRRVSTGAQESSSRSTSTGSSGGLGGGGGGGGAVKSSRPSLPLAPTRPGSYGSAVKSPIAGSDTEGKITGGLRNVWKKLRSGSRTPAALPSPRNERLDSRANVSLPAGGDATDRASRSGSTRSTSAEYPVSSTVASSPRASQDAETEAHLNLLPSDLDAQMMAMVAAAAAAARNDSQHTYEAKQRPIYPEEVVSDSSDSLSDFDDEEDYGEALSPTEQDNITQPSSFGTQQPLMWSDPVQGWHTSPKLVADPLGRFFRQQHSRRESESGSSSMAANLADTSDSAQDLTPKAITRVSLGDISYDRASDNDVVDDVRPFLSRDGSISKEVSAKVSPSTPIRLSEVSHALGHMADDENDDDEEEEVMIKPRSRLRRATDTSKESGPFVQPPAGHRAPVVSYPGG